MIAVTESENATFFCSPISNAVSYVVEKLEPGSVAFILIAFDDPHFERELQVENNREVFRYTNVMREDNGTIFRCVLGGLPSDGATLIVEPSKLPISYSRYVANCVLLSQKRCSAGL